ncbi:patatin-like phospholipase family protein [Actinosynnema sp. NPDC050801]|uniref:patatin-like phospholipase family protein n=1 Tax=unclassified Actinosynnema TaxID=2637065 RepID=UPI0033DE2344
MVSVVIQGGAMRSIYCLGAVRALVDSGLANRVTSIHSASAGCVSAAVLASHIADEQAPAVAETGQRLVDVLANRRFINPSRLRRIVDVDYLVTTMRELTPISVESLGSRGLVFEVGLTEAETARAHYIDIAQVATDEDLVQALRATMAIPALYPPKVLIGGRRYVDGGIADPLPLLRALVRAPKVVVAISSVPERRLARTLQGREARMIQHFPGIPATIKHLMLTLNPLADAVDRIVSHGSIGGIRVIRISPTDPALVGSRLEVDPGRLRKLEELGYTDGLASLATIGEVDGDGVLTAGTDVTGVDG